MEMLFEENKEVYHKVKSLLKLYRKVVWNLKEEASEIKSRFHEQAEAYRLSKQSLAEISEYLNDCFMTDNAKLEDKLMSVNQTKILVEIIEKSLFKLRTYPNDGELYYNIIVKTYMEEKALKEIDILQFVHLERTTFYKRKKEALHLMSVTIWGFMQPELLNYKGVIIS